MDHVVRGLISTRCTGAPFRPSLSITSALEPFRGPCLGGKASAHADPPNIAPTAVVNPIANDPQKETRSTDGSSGAPPARAASTPNSTRKTSELPATAHIDAEPGTIRTTSTGSTAPTAKLPADAIAACIGFAAEASEMPSSSLRCAPSASWFISWVATCEANT